MRTHPKPLFRRPILTRAVREYFQATTSALNLAVFRIVLFGVLAFFAWRLDAVWFATIPRELLDPPRGLDWIVRHVPITADWALLSRAVLIVSSLSAALGFWTRASAVMAVVSGLYVLGLPQLWGKVGHYHHLIWFAAILAASPSGDSWSVDAWRRKQPLPAPSATYALPLRLIWLLFGLIYFFPGLSKLSLGTEWFWSDNLKYQMYHKWMELPTSFVPLFRLDHYPALVRIAALAVVAFELTFIGLLFVPRLRVVAVTGGLLFHFMTAKLIGISFWPLWTLYVAFVDWAGLARRLGWNPPVRATPAPVRARAHLRVAGVGGSWIAAAFFCGFLGFDSWPVGVYPGFGFIAGPTKDSIEIHLRDESGHLLRTDGLAKRVEARMGGGNWALLAALVARHPNPATRERLAKGLVDLLVREDSSLAASAVAEVYRVTLWTEPERAHANLVRRDLLATIEIDR